MKRLISFVLTLTLIFSVFAASAVNVSAATLNDTKLYYQYVKNNYTLTNLEGFYKNHSYVNNSVFSIVTKDFNGDGVKEMILFFVRREPDPAEQVCVYARLFGIRNGSVAQLDKSGDFFYGFGSEGGLGNGTAEICVEQTSKGFKVYFPSALWGGDRFRAFYMQYDVSGNKLVEQKEYYYYDFPREDMFEANESVSGKIFGTYSDFMKAVRNDGFNTSSHNNCCVYDTALSYKQICDNRHAQGNHIFTIATDYHFATETYYAYIHDNTNLQYKINHLSCPYPDVPTNSWYYEGVKYCYQKDFILGFDNGNF